MTYDKNKYELIKVITQDKILFFDNIKLEIAMHYNYALEILAKDKKTKVVTINLDIAKHLKDALAYDEVLYYLKNSLSVLDKQDKSRYWQYLFLKIDIHFNTSQITKIQNIIKIVKDTFLDNKYKNDSHIQRNKVKSILAIPMVQNKLLKGILYCKNNLIGDVFSEKIAHTTSMILSQLIISLDNAFIYENMETLVSERTQELQKTKDEVENIHKHIKDSIRYASLIQKVVVSQSAELSTFFRDHFVTWIPKDTVGGDIWLFNKLRHQDECLLKYIIDSSL